MTKLIPRHTNGDSLRDHMNGKGKTTKKDNAGEKKEAQRKTREQFDYVNPGRDPEKERQQRKLGAYKIYQLADQFDDTGAVRANQGASNMLPEVTAGAEATNGIKYGNNLPDTNIGDVTIVGDRNKILTPHQRQIRDQRLRMMQDRLAEPAKWRRLGAGLSLAGEVALHSRNPYAITAGIIGQGLGYGAGAMADYKDDENREWYQKYHPELLPKPSVFKYNTDNFLADVLNYGLKLGGATYPWMKIASYIPEAYAAGTDTYTLVTGDNPF